MFAGDEGVHREGGGEACDGAFDEYFYFRRQDCLEEALEVVDLYGDCSLFSTGRRTFRERGLTLGIGAVDGRVQFHG